MMSYRVAMCMNRLMMKNCINYQDEEHPSDADEPTYPAKAAGIGGLIASIKSTLAEGSLTDKLRRLLIPVLLGMLIFGVWYL